MNPTRKAGNLIDFPDDLNGRVLTSMQASGADMTASYDIDFEHVFPDLAAAERFRDLAVNRGKSEIAELDGADGYFWEVRVVVHLVPTHADVTRVEGELGAMAEKCEGRSDGWGILHGP